LTSDRETVDFLASVPLLAGREEADLVDLARVMRRRTLPAGEILWRQGDDARELVFIVDGSVSAFLRLAGDRTVEIARVSPGEMVGEIALLDGGGHTMGVRATEASTVLALGRAEFAALLARRDSSAFALRRRLAVVFTERLRNQLQRLAVSLGGEVSGPSAEQACRAFAELEHSGPPDSKYVRRMATFHDFDSLALWSFPDVRELRALPAGARVGCRRGAVNGLLPHDEWRSRGGAGPQRPANPRRPGGAGEGIRL
jgi:CRP-like cAMP-binding protein